jgi:excisionase family DNA binding protein
VNDELLTPSEVAAMFHVDPKTVTRWAKAGKLTAIRTLGGHRRFKRAEGIALLGRDEDAPMPTRTALGQPWWDETEE